MIENPTQYFRKMKAEFLKTTGKYADKIILGEVDFFELANNMELIDRLRYVKVEGGFSGGPLNSDQLARVLGFDEIEVQNGYGHIVCEMVPSNG